MYNVDNTFVTPWGDYDIAVRVGREAAGRLVGAITSSYEILRAGRLLAAAAVPAAYLTEKDAAESALRIAKLDARELLEGPFPGY